MNIGGSLKELSRILGAAGELRPLLPEVARGVFDSVRSGVASLKDLAAALMTAEARARELAGARRRQRRALRAELEAIRRTADALAVDRPEVDPSAFRIPGRGDQKLLAGARSVAESVGPVEESFLEYAMAPEFLASLEQRIRDFDRTLTRTGETARRVDDLRVRIRAAIRESRAGARRLDPIVRNVLGDDDIALAGWEKVCPGSRPRRRKSRPVSPDSQSTEAAR